MGESGPHRNVGEAMKEEGRAEMEGAVKRLNRAASGAGGHGSAGFRMGEVAAEKAEAASWFGLLANAGSGKGRCGTGGLCLGWGNSTRLRRHSKRGGN